MRGGCDKASGSVRVGEHLQDGGDNVGVNPIDRFDPPTSAVILRCRTRPPVGTPDCIRFSHILVISSSNTLQASILITSASPESEVHL